MVAFANSLSQTHSWEYPFPLGSRSAARRSHLLRDDALLAAAAAKQARREQHAILHLAASIASAKSLSGVCGRPSIDGWPVAWIEQACHIYCPPVDGVVDDPYVGNDSLVDFVIVPRFDGMHMLADYWDAFHHIGAVPDVDEKV